MAEKKKTNIRPIYTVQLTETKTKTKIIVTAKISKISLLDHVC